jgi:hypothetical protein
MTTRMRILPVVAIVGLLATVDARSVQKPNESPAPALDSRIPVADRAKYRSIRDAKDWLNPKLIMLPDGIQVIAAGIDGRKVVAPEDLRETLLKLPVDAWPYGRVVGASDASIRTGVRRDDERIKRNHDAAEKILKALRVEADWWPS